MKEAFRQIIALQRRLDALESIVGVPRDASAAVDEDVAKSLADPAAVEMWRRHAWAEQPDATYSILVRQKWLYPGWPKGVEAGDWVRRELTPRDTEPVEIPSEDGD